VWPPKIARAIGPNDPDDAETTIAPNCIVNKFKRELIMRGLLSPSGIYLFSEINPIRVSILENMRYIVTHLKNNKTK
jgi:hypothetical protein